jgi:hypothetical protein
MWHGAGPVEEEKDPGEQGVQVEAPAGQRSTRQPLNSTAPVHGCGYRLRRGETEKTCTVSDGACCCIDPSTWP